MRKILFFIWIVGWCAPSDAIAEKIKVFAAIDHRPFVSIVDDKPGFLVDLLEAMAPHAGLTVEFEYYPWKRSQMLAKTEPGTFIINLGRTSKRENQYKWVVNLMSTTYVLASLNKPYNSLEEVRLEEVTIGVLPGTPRDHILTKANMSGVVRPPSPEGLVTGLKIGHIKAWFGVSHRIAYVWKDFGNDPKVLVYGKPIKTVDLYLAANPNTSDSYKPRLQAAYEKVVASGKMKEILRSYIGDSAF